ncbi:MAG: hypothetical protein VKS61_06065 [Candidatus Sericytochromatia bacterium]|nr:hypothetical protein [Candidatus Sericytochromatia bacterium]
MLTTVTGLMILTSLVSIAANRSQWDAYQQGKLTRGQIVNRITTTVFVVLGTLALLIAKMSGL